MPEREYFSFRYVIPGFTFILLVIAINNVPLLKILKESWADSAFGAFLGFLSLFAGSAIGFLISQFWYWWLHGHPILEKDEFENIALEILKFLKSSKEIEEIKNNNLSKEEIHKNIEAINTIFEYVIRLEKQDKFFELAERRWDMYNVLSCTKLILVIGVIAGSICRVYYHYSVFDGSLSSSLINAEVVALIMILISVGSLLVVFCRAGKRLWSEESPQLMRAIVIKSTEENQKLKEDVEKLFPKYFNNKNC